MLQLRDVINILEEEEDNLKDRLVGLKDPVDFHELVGKLKALKQVKSKLTTRFQSG